jgi:hypothetical protein
LELAMAGAFLSHVPFAPAEIRKKRKKPVEFFCCMALPCKNTRMFSEMLLASKSFIRKLSTLFTAIHQPRNFSVARPRKAANLPPTISFAA